MTPRLRPVLLGALVAAALAAASVALAATSSGRHPAATAPHRAAAAAAAPPARKLTIDQLAGQRIIYAYAGLRPPASLLAAIRAGEAGGVIFFAPNIASLPQIRGVVAQLQRASRASPVHAPLLLMTDQEGGEVRRLPGPPTWSEKQIGASRAGASLARAAGTAAGRTLAGVGMNVNLAPVLDVYRQPGNFIDEFQRSYSSNPGRVATLGASFIAAQQRVGVAATAKHFPGLGAAARAQDTDVRPVTLNLSLTTLRSVDEAPYRPAIAAGVKLVMTSWAIYPALDPRRPAGLSPAVIGGELRGRLGFRGVTVTDGIDAGAVTPYGNLATRGVLAASAGADMILCAAVNPAANTPSQGLTVMRALAAAIGSHRISRGAAQAAAARILALRAHS
jgi:beta-N-acetylhexosaminidase